MVISGALFVMIAGPSMMLRWCVDSYISPVQMWLWATLHLGQELVPSGWTMFCVLAVNNNYQNVLTTITTASEVITVIISRTLV